MIEINTKNYSKIILLLLGFSSVIWNANPANAIIGTEYIDNTAFSIDTFGLNNAAGNSTIGTTADPEGFNRQFDTTVGNTFLLLGATDVDSTINGGPTNNTQSTVNVTATYNTVDITPSNISDGLLNISFDWAFQGTNQTFDSFLVGLVPEGGGVGGLGDGVVILPQGNYDIQNFNDNIDISGLNAGNYDLIVSLTDATLPGNSAAGFDNITISEVPVGVPFKVSPNLGLFILGGLFLSSSHLKRRKLETQINS